MFKRQHPERPRRSLVGAPPVGAEPPPSQPQPKPKPVEQSPSNHRSFPKTVQVRSETYMAFVRRDPCCGCGAPGPSDPHHFGSRGVGQKTDDRRTVPLCRKCHDEFHAHGFLGSSSGFASGKSGRVETERLFYKTQVNLLLRWMDLIAIARTEEQEQTRKPLRSEQKGKRP